MSIDLREYWNRTEPLLTFIWEYKKGLGFLFVLFLWAAIAFSTPTVRTTVAIGDNVAQIAGEHDKQVLPLSEMNPDDKAVFIDRMNNYSRNKAAVRLFDNEADFVASAGPHGNFYYQRVDTGPESTENQQALRGFFDNYYFVNTSANWLVGKFQKDYTNSDPSTIVLAQTDTQIVFYNDRWQALFWHFAPFSPGFILPAAILIFIRIVSRNRKWEAGREQREVEMKQALQKLKEHDMK